MRGAEVVAESWAGTRAGMFASVVVVVRENGGMPWIAFEPGDMPPIALARCLQAITDKMVVQESARLAKELNPNDNLD